MGWITTIFDQLLEDAPKPTMLRIARVLRPLRSLTFLPTLQRVVNSLFASAKDLQDVGIVIGFVMLLLALLGKNLYSGFLGNRCEVHQLWWQCL